MKLAANLHLILCNMKFLLTICAASMLFTGCATRHSFETASGVVQWHKTSLDDIQSICLNNNIHSPLLFKIRGCYRITDNVCHIYAQDGKENMAYLGHELKHCFDGLFHAADGKWPD